MATDIRLRGSSRRGGGIFKAALLLLVAAIAIALAVAGFLLFELEKPTLVLERELRFLGGKVELPLRAADGKSGLRSLVLTLTQGDTTHTLLEKTFPRQAWFGQAGPAAISEKVVIDAHKAGIKEGNAELTVTVRDFSLFGWLRGNRTLARLPVTMDTKPPKLALVQSQRSLRPGGSGVAVYTVSESPGRHGVLVENLFFPGYPGPKENTFVAYFALPWDAKPQAAFRVLAADEAGNEVSLALPVTIRPTENKHDSITLSDVFLERKIPEFEEHYPNLQGSLLEKYLHINRAVRDENAGFIAKACAETASKQLWTDRFVRMPGAGRAGFADQRDYLYNGQTIDHQTHLGVDIASTERAEIRAANRGKVVFAGYLGIYGNMIILDHGQGIASLYSHLSSIDTTVGTLVDKNQPIGHSGTTGMAGGDHLHFSMLVHGIFVTPTEWWDQHWIDVNIKSALNAK